MKLDDILKTLAQKVERRFNPKSLPISMVMFIPTISLDTLIHELGHYLGYYISKPENVKISYAEVDVSLWINKVFYFRIKPNFDIAIKNTDSTIINYFPSAAGITCVIPYPHTITHQILYTAGGPIADVFLFSFNHYLSKKTGNIYLKTLFNLNKYFLMTYAIIYSLSGSGDYNVLSKLLDIPQGVITLSVTAIYGEILRDFASIRTFKEYIQDLFYRIFTDDGLPNRNKWKVLYWKYRRFKRKLRKLEL